MEYGLVSYLSMKPGRGRMAGGWHVSFYLGWKFNENWSKTCDGSSNDRYKNHNFDNF